MNRVVIVEDSVLHRKGLILTTEWEKIDCEVVGEAENGIEGIEVILRLSPDIVITDIKMPGLDGIQMIERLKDKTDAVFIIMSGYSEFEYARSAIKLGVVDYLMKPIEDKEFVNTIRNACQAVNKRKNINKIQSKIDKMDDSRIMLFQEYLIGNDSTKTIYVEEAVSYIQQHFREDINVKNISDTLQISASHL
ncbi:MAG: response regulator, partial [Epulopiscium sp.]|nr:response regulator [Candidatus Epulonipiscium sp.]